MKKIACVAVTCVLLTACNQNQQDYKPQGYDQGQQQQGYYPNQQGAIPQPQQQQAQQQMAPAPAPPAASPSIASASGTRQGGCYVSISYWDDATMKSDPPLVFSQTCTITTTANGGFTLTPNGGGTMFSDYGGPVNSVELDARDGRVDLSNGGGFTGMRRSKSDRACWKGGSEGAVVEVCAR
ncbi:MAG TPA: hypothetical protein PKN09_02625 [Novosphingobium sp.]|nr:hypothetical protein [Novosphingobium sp.]